MSPLVEAVGVRKAYRRRGSPLPVLEGVDLEIAVGEVVGLLGENGSGKTTLVKTIAGIIPRDGGVIRVCGHDPTFEPRRVAGSLGAVFPGGRSVYWRLSARENLRYYAQLRGGGLDHTAIERALELFDLASVADIQLRRLSTGLRQRVAVACAAVHRPRVLLLDEPTLGLDAAARALLLRWLAATAADGAAVLITSHDGALLEEICQRVLVLRGGVAAFDGPAGELRRHLSDRRAYVVAVDGLSRPLGCELQALGAAESTVSDELVFHRADGRFLAEAIPLIRRHGGILRDLTMRERPLGELLGKLPRD